MSISNKQIPLKLIVQSGMVWCMASFAGAGILNTLLSLSSRWSSFEDRVLVHEIYGYLTLQ